MPNGYPTEQACTQARDRLKRLGLSAKGWALQNGLTPSTVYAVLNGQKKCLRGEAHRAAVLLGIKQGEIPATTAAQHYGRTAQGETGR
ncbi:DNA-binding protein [Pseudomonas oryzihabitans]|uniref:DNA-binding protein n=1 Tax=Pseudomonas oryzihabitans TaxID=47885 RepID=UPI002893C048|nr:DNA-binding protein [Pseudomonas oryzihabitans]MDT3723194.1 DNA-binding protein [Pseudomonas oryzihabitans]